ncbi:MAG: hypothetical protein MUP55_03725, partial [Candidatus Aenigmarchaeota archaeon]|nr:hypothetical protein [Candidatus Aenigmarchaeota archaeon]
MDELKEKELKAMIVELEKIRGRHTELVTVYIPAGFSLPKVSEQIRSEQSTAQNIKSKTVRKNVLGALERIMQHLKLYKQTPSNGLVIFCGNVSDKEGVADLELWTLEPHEPIKTRLYWCGQEFILDPLKEMVKEREIYGIIVVDKSNAAIGVLKGKKVSLLKNLDSIVPGKTKAGGWCVHEDSLLRLEEGKTCKIKEVGNRKFLCYDFKTMKTVFAKHNHFFSRTSEKALEIITTYPKLKIKVTPEHVFFVTGNKEFEKKPARKLTENDKLFVVRKPSSNLMSAKISSIKEVEPPGLFYDMEVPKYENFIANGLILHNSANRYARIREGLLNDFLKKVGEVATANFKQLPDLKGVIIGGPGPIKEQFAEGDFLEYTITGKVLGIVNTSYTGEYGLKEAVDRSEDLIAEASVIREKRILDRFFAELEKDSGLAVYGFFETANALKAGNIELLLIPEAFDWVRTNFECPSCGYKAEKILDRKQIDEQK